MDSRTKVGLIGTFFVIVVIVFVMGKFPSKLPSLQNGTDENEGAQTLMSPRVDPPGIAARERRAQQQYGEQVWHAVEQELAPINRPFQQIEDSDVGAEVRIILPLPESVGPAIQPAESTETREQTLQPLPEPVRPRTYVVKSGDNLALIAKQFYGQVEGNRMNTIARLFAANRGALRTPDKLRVGQRIVIPPVNPLASRALEAITVPARSVGESKLNQIKADPPTYRPTDRWHVVRDGDSLWTIASARLGNGGLYPEIARLNSAIIENEDHLPVGLRLRLPVQ